MEPRNDIRRITMQRNGAAAAAVLIISFGIALCLPNALERRKRLQAENDNLLYLQRQIELTQSEIRNVQKHILQAQSDIRTLLNESH